MAVVSRSTGLIRRLAARSINNTPVASMSTAAAPSPSQLLKLEDNFRFAVDKYLPQNGKGVVFATAWLATDNIIVHLLRKHFPELLDGSGLLAVDTLHLFPETYKVAEEVQKKYNKKAYVTKPLGCETTADFDAKYGHCETLSHADFDLHSKVEPYQRGLNDLGKDILITGRRMDQAAKRISLDAWEAKAKILNPMADWTWPDITAFVDKEGVPVNGAHNYVYRSSTWIDPKLRHREGLPWTVTDLGKPYWRASEAELKGTPPAAHAMVRKSFGDLHTSVPVYPHETERAGRFVRSSQTECGIHTRVGGAGVPHGGVLVDRMVTDAAKRAELLKSATRTIELNERQVCDVELIVNGGFSPLTGFLTKDEYDHVVKDMRLPEQQLWAMPITLDTDDATVKVGEHVALKYKGETVAVVKVDSFYEPNKETEAFNVFGTSSLEHPGVYDLAVQRGKYYIGGPVFGLATPQREMKCKSPVEVRKELPKGKPVVAFQCRNPIHRAHFELVRRALADIKDATVLIHPTVGPTQPGDIDGLVRVATYEALAKEVGNERIKWAFLPYNMQMAGPREAIMHMIIRKNFGCTHFIVGRDMAGTKSTRTEKDFYDPYAAQEAGKSKSAELSVDVVTYENMMYTGVGESGFTPESEAKAAKLPVKKLSGTEFRRLLRAGESIPQWFAFDSVIKALRDYELKQGAKA